MNTTSRPVALLLSGCLAAVLAMLSGCQSAPVAANPERPGAPVGPITLAADDVRAFPPAPAGFADEYPGRPRGTVVTFSYDSPVTHTRRTANVYLPPGYTAQRRYPVLYLLHGIGGNQEEWRGYVRAQAILDNLIAGGQAVPMIVVLPNGRALADDRPPPGERTFAPAHIAGFEAFERELLQTLIPAIDAAYPTLAVREQRAIAGLSMGGGQSLNIGLGHVDTFAWIGAFSAAPNTRAPATLLPQASQAAPLRLLYLSCGNRDNLLAISQGVHRHLRQQGVPHVWNVDEHGHDAASWGDNLYHFARLLFRPAS
jgi:enterochelin esterase-like enzyme